MLGLSPGLRCEVFAHQRVKVRISELPIDAQTLTQERALSRRAPAFSAARWLARLSTAARILYALESDLFETEARREQWLILR